jgi:hypothetical protein
MIDSAHTKHWANWNAFCWSVQELKPQGGLTNNTNIHVLAS